MLHEAIYSALILSLLNETTISFYYSRDIFTALAHAEVCRALKQLFTTHLKRDCSDIDVVCGLEARGFLFGFQIAADLGVGFVPIRKKGKLPGELLSQEYSLEYGTDKFEIQKSSIKPGQRVLIVDDLLATGGTMEAARLLIEKSGGVVVECLVLIELAGLNGRDKLKGCPTHSFIQYD